MDKAAATIEHRVGHEVVWRAGDVERLVYHYATDRHIDRPGFTYINPSLVLAEPYDLAAGAVLRLRYRVVALEGGLKAPALENQRAAFAHGCDAPEGELACISHEDGRSGRGGPRGAGGEDWWPGAGGHG